MKMIEKIKEALYEQMNINRHINHDDIINVGLEQALSIINEVEAKWNEDVCEWKAIKNGEFIQNPHTGRMFSSEPSMQNVYCNTCGKKIKVV